MTSKESALARVKEMTREIGILNPIKVTQKQGEPLEGRYRGYDRHEGSLKIEVIAPAEQSKMHPKTKFVFVPVENVATVKRREAFGHGAPFTSFNDY